jgi:hypothetical protein
MKIIIAIAAFCLLILSFTGCEKEPTSSVKSDALPSIQPGQPGPGIWTVTHYMAELSVDECYLEKYSPDGKVVFRSQPFSFLDHLLLRRSTGEIYYNHGGDRFAKRDDIGNIIATADLSGYTNSSLNQNDGSLWYFTSYSEEHPSQVKKLDANLSPQVVYSGLGYIRGIACYSNDSSCWVAGEDTIYATEERLIRLNSNGEKVFEMNLEFAPGNIEPSPMQVDERDGSCWIYSRNFMSSVSILHKYSLGGELSAEVDLGGKALNSYAIDPNDGSLYLTTMSDQILKYNSEGQQLWQVNQICDAISVADDGSVWACKYINDNDHKLLHLSSSGTVLGVTGLTDFSKALVAR